MQVKINGKTIELAENISIMDFIKTKNLSLESVIVQHNLTILKKEDWSQTILVENDVLEILSFVGGG